MKFLAYDCETNGMPLFDQPSDDPRQPHIVQIAWSLFDITNDEPPLITVATIKPDGWVIPPEMTAIHGISQEHAESVGIPEHDAVDELFFNWQPSAARIAHNEPFDARILRIAIMRHLGRQIADQWKAGTSLCTAKAATNHCCLPPSAKMKAKGMSAYKTPKLQEAHEKLIGSKFESAHTAGGDVAALITVARKLYQLGEFR
jgi:DNA polymerase-3 subunit epsilon